MKADFSLVFTEPIGLSYKSATYIRYTAADVNSTFHTALVKSNKNENMYKLDRFTIDKNSITIEPGELMSVSWNYNEIS